MAAVTVQNITATSARVSWPPSPGCLDTFYSVMYHPNWSSFLMSYTRKSFLREERIPVSSQTSAGLTHLTPQTTYILCVTCQAANPTRDQCRVFNTLNEVGEGFNGTGWELAMGVWLASSILLLVIAAVLLWGCLRSVCPGPGDSRGSCPGATGLPGADGGRGSPGGLYTSSSSSEEESRQDRIKENPFHTAQSSAGLRHSQSHELGTLTKPSDG